MTALPHHQAPERSAGPPTLPGRVVRLVHLLDRALGRLDRVIVVVCCALLFGLFSVVIIAVFFRYVVNSSLLWGEELVRYMAIWLVFLGLSCAHRRSEHVSLTSALGWIPGISAALARRIGESITFVFCVAIAYFGVLATAGNFINRQVSPAMQIGIAWIYLAIPVGFALLALQSLVRIFLTPPVQTTVDSVKES